MNKALFEISNNWSAFPELNREVSWLSSHKADSFIVFESKVDTAQWYIRVNDFPDEPMFTLIIGNKEIIHFDDWPAFWGEQPAFPK